MPQTPVVGQTFTFGVGLFQQADVKLLQANPTLAAGDFQRSINGGAFANLDNLPTVTPALGTRVQVIISAAETTAAGAGGEIWVRWIDQAGAEWCDGFACVRPATVDIDDLNTIAFPAGAISFTYTVTDSGTGLPVEGAEVWFATDAAYANIVWKGDTDAFGVARDVTNALPLLDAGTYYVRVQRAGYADLDDTEVVS